MSDQVKFVWEVTFEQTTNGMKQTELQNSFANMVMILADEFARKHKLEQADSRLTLQRQPSKKIKR